MLNGRAVVAKVEQRPGPAVVLAHHPVGGAGLDDLALDEVRFPFEAVRQQALDLGACEEVVADDVLAGGMYPAVIGQGVPRLAVVVTSGMDGDVV